MNNFIPKMTYDYESQKWVEGDEVKPVLLKRYKKFLAELENEKTIILNCIKELEELKENTIK